MISGHVSTCIDVFLGEDPLNLRHAVLIRLDSVKRSETCMRMTIGESVNACMTPAEVKKLRNGLSAWLTAHGENQ